VGPIAALLTAFHQVLLFSNALGSIGDNPVLEFPAAIINFSKFLTLVFHPGLDAKSRDAVRSAGQALWILGIAPGNGRCGPRVEICRQANTQMAARREMERVERLVI